MSKCAIMQPTYLPWAGYFHLIGSVDYFVLLDDVQFERRSWQTRNRIMLAGVEHMMSIPTKKMPRDSAILNKVETSPDINFKAHHWAILERAYRKAEFGNVALDVLREHYHCDRISKLTDFTARIIDSLCVLLDIRTPKYLASSLNCGGKRSDHLAEICRSLDCDSYLSPKGSASYLEKDAFCLKHGIKLEFQAYKAQVYNQYMSTNFVSHLSVVDVLANLGVEKTRQYVLGM